MPPSRRGDSIVREREAKARQTGSTPRGRPPTPPTPGARGKDQYNCTDPESRIMKNSNNDGFDQHDNAQAAVEQTSFLMVANTLSNHPNDQAEALPTLDRVPRALGTPKAGALDNGYFSATNIAAMDARDIEPYIATGRVSHHLQLAVSTHNSPRHRQPMPVQRCTWLTNFKPTLAVRSTAYAHVQSNRCWALSKTSWAFAKARFVACGPPLAHGVWCVSPST